MKILALSGSLRAGSLNGLVLQAAGELADADVELERFDGLKAIPPYDADDDVAPAPAAVTRFRKALAEADAVLIATPEYNSSIPGVLKNALDWASRPLATSPLRNKPVAVVGASTGAFGAVWAQAELRKVLAATGARVVDGELPFAHAHTRFDDGGRLVDEELAERLRELVDGLAATAREREATLVA
jgi:chromate reductase